MLVQCPKCKTTYKVSDDVVKGAAPSFRCSRCKHTFDLEAEPESPTDVSHASAGEAGNNRELVFRFEPATRAEPESSRVGSPTGGTTDPKLAALADANPEHRKRDSSGQDNKLSAIAASAQEAANSVPAAPPMKEQPYSLTPPALETIDKVLAIEPYRDQPASTLPFLTLFASLAIFSVFLVAYQMTQPTALEGWVRRIPILGPSLVRNEYLKRGVLLKFIETKFQSLQGSRDVVVLSGVAVNQNPVMIRNVQLRGVLYNHDGKEIERQTMWIGNAISSQIIRGMSAQDIADLQRLKPLKTFEIPPGDSVPFAIVFLRTGKQVKDARYEVLSAEAGA
jgi:predicted Zn finger-like uncharacterized protein